MSVAPINNIMVSVEDAENLIRSELRDFGSETIPFDAALGRVLAEDLLADRDLPPINRATMDGIAIRFDAFKKGLRTFRIKGTQAAGGIPIEIAKPEECIEIMTGAAVPGTADTIVRYEDLDIQNEMVTIQSDTIRQGQNIHFKGSDKKQGEIIAASSHVITPAIIGLAATTGKSKIRVKKLPRTIIISSGDELTAVDSIPSDYQLRRSNNYTIAAALQGYGIKADMLHIPDNKEISRQQISESLNHYDVLILTGGVSKGKFDFIPEALESSGVVKIFHKVRQKPGKPFWFGRDSGGSLVFAFPGNPVSTFLCLYRYFLPWLEASLGLDSPVRSSAVLGTDFSFTPALQYFLQVQLKCDREGRLIAFPAEGNGSGDLANLAVSNAFMELPKEENNFTKGGVYRVWQYGRI